eukprot:00612.XXX_1171_1669_1 [CDS] Oithona nana genome sequencing.
MFAAKSGGWLNTLVFIFMNTQFRAAILPSWILDYWGKDESRQGDHKDVDETPQNMSAASKTPKTPNNSVEVPTAADAVTVENCPTTQIRS